ncbi:hypothetical protein FOMPIDRAFT_1100661, partial [Fomitopsis schrenkii]
CDLCDVAFVSEALLRAHFSNSTRHASCSRCGLGFKDLHTLSKLCFDLQQHYNYSAQHPKCDTCGTGCATAADVVKVSATGPTAHPLAQCELCEKRFQTVDHLRDHYRDSPRHPQCASCKVGF